MSVSRPDSASLSKTSTPISDTTPTQVLGKTASSHQVKQITKGELGLGKGSFFRRDSSKDVASFEDVTHFFNQTVSKKGKAPDIDPERKQEIFSSYKERKAVLENKLDGGRLSWFKMIVMKMILKKADSVLLSIESPRAQKLVETLDDLRDIIVEYEEEIATKNKKISELKTEINAKPPPDDLDEKMNLLKSETKELADLEEFYSKSLSTADLNQKQLEGIYNNFPALRPPKSEK